MYTCDNTDISKRDEPKECSSSVSTSERQMEEESADQPNDEINEVALALDVSSRESAWKPTNESIRIVEAMANDGASPRQVVESLLPNVTLPEDISNEELCRIIQQIIHSDRPKRDKLLNYNTFSDAVELLKRSQHILVLTGAGVSVSCGIPDFRSKDGIYARLRVDFPDLPDPTAMFDISYFIRNPKPFFEFAKEIFPGQFKASICHYFIKMLETEGKLLRNYTQNIDTLEQVAGITRIVQCHGSFSKATCRHCGSKFDGDVIKEDVLAKRIAMCQVCGDPKGVLKPDIVFFGEDLPDEFHDRMVEDKDQVDLVVVIGSSLKVQPVALIPFSVDASVPQILINREPLPHYSCDIELLGNCDDIITQFIVALGDPYTQLLEHRESVSANEHNVANGSVDNREHRDVPSSHIAQSRKQIDEVEFKRLIAEPDMKKARTDANASPLWDGRYVSVESKLPPDSFLFIAPNRSVFPGAELFYDKDEDVFCQLRQQHYTSSLSSVSGSECESDSDEESESLISRFNRTHFRRVQSLPPDHRISSDHCHNEGGSHSKRSASSPASGKKLAKLSEEPRNLDRQQQRSRLMHRVRYFSEGAAYSLSDVLRAELARH
ncbi:unnamed protein product [Anisakis simplex]|uniref:NAD-dependent protein deacetylase sir-2.1 n=1 Tax=Anisakis simplex TaxID=6269 RepID=A0A0M3JSB0_ANISI|nr:unnamed protein product [Anisakis simplex]